MESERRFQKDSSITVRTLSDRVAWSGSPVCSRQFGARRVRSWVTLWPMHADKTAQNANEADGEQSGHTLFKLHLLNQAPDRLLGLLKHPRDVASSRRR